MYTDEAKVSNGYNRQIWVTRQPGEEFQADCLVPLFKIHTGVMVWAAVWHGGRSPLIHLDLSESEGKKGGFTSVLYRDQVLKPVLLPLWRDFKKGKPDPYIVEDNSRIHDSPVCQGAKRHMRMTLHPPYSPDLNPIEHVWAELKRRMNLIARLPANKDKLFEIAARVWDEIEQEFIDKCVDSMPQRLADVVANKGGHTRW
jgi:transposase